MGKGFGVEWIYSHAGDTIMWAKPFQNDLHTWLSWRNVTIEMANFQMKESFSQPWIHPFLKLERKITIAPRTRPLSLLAYSNQLDVTSAKKGKNVIGIRWVSNWIRERTYSFTSSSLLLGSTLFSSFCSGTLLRLGISHQWWRSRLHFLQYSRHRVVVILRFPRDKDTQWWWLLVFSFPPSFA